MQPIRLSDEHLTYLLTVLRAADQPMTTQELVEALRRRLGADSKSS